MDYYLEYNITQNGFHYNRGSHPLNTHGWFSLAPKPIHDANCKLLISILKIAYPNIGDGRDFKVKGITEEKIIKSCEDIMNAINKFFLACAEVQPENFEIKIRRGDLN